MKLEALGPRSNSTVAYEQWMYAISLAKYCIRNYNTATPTNNAKRLK